MIAVFAAPMVATWFYFFFPEYLPEAHSNRGEILSPAVALAAGLGLSTPSGEPLDPGSLEGAWVLTYLVDATCAEECLERLVQMRQIRLGLGENGRLVERLLLVTDPQGPVDLALMERAFEGMLVALTDAGGRARMLAVLGSGPEALGRLYILDPQGRLMMRYAVDAPAKDTLKDMERLLKGSKNWIKGANYGHD